LYRGGSEKKIRAVEGGAGIVSASNWYESNNSPGLVGRDYLS
jgi:hypothetical protein